MDSIKDKSANIIKKGLMGVATKKDWLDYQDEVFYSCKYGCKSNDELYKIVVRSKHGGQSGLLNAYNILSGFY